MGEKHCICEYSCSEMSESTGVCAADIISTLHALDILRCENNRYAFLAKTSCATLLLTVMVNKDMNCTVTKMLVNYL